jgi:hypothetical protein
MLIADRIRELAQQVAVEWPDFFTKKGPGKGDRDTNRYMKELRRRVQEATGCDYAEKRICGNSALAVDFYIESEATVIEVALGLRNPNCEFERDILKALMACEQGNQVERLLFIAKPGGAKRVSQPSSRAIIAWAQKKHHLRVEVQELAPAATPASVKVRE